MTACAGATTSPTHAFPTLEPHTPAPTIDYQHVQRFAINEPIELTNDGVTVSARLKVTRVAQVSGFGNVGLPGNAPRFVGPVFLAVEIKFEAVHGPFSYSPATWSIVDGANHEFSYADPPDGPKQMLREQGTLPEGASITGWLIFEVAPEGLALLSPTQVRAPEFEQKPLWVVVVRDADARPPTGTPVPAGANP
jgi:hypothetical protein